MQNPLDPHAQLPTTHEEMAEVAIHRANAQALAIFSTFPQIVFECHTFCYHIFCGVLGTLYAKVHRVAIVHPPSSPTIERVGECLPVLCVWPRRKQMVIWQLNFLASSGHSFSQSASQQHSLADCEWLYQTHNNNISILPRCPRQAATKKLHHTAIPAQILF